MPSNFTTDSNGIMTLIVAPTGDAGQAINTSLSVISSLITAIQTSKAPVANPTFTGTVTAPTVIGNVTGNVTGTAGRLATNAPIMGAVLAASCGYCLP